MSESDSLSGLPTSRVSRRASSWRCAAIMSASLNSKAPRSTGESLAQGPRRAASAARAARSMSADAPRGTFAIGSSVAGSRVANTSPLVASTQSFSMKSLWCIRTPNLAADGAGSNSLNEIALEQEEEQQARQAQDRHAGHSQGKALKLSVCTNLRCEGSNSDG